MTIKYFYNMNEKYLNFSELWCLLAFYCVCPFKSGLRYKLHVFKLYSLWVFVILHVHGTLATVDFHHFPKIPCAPLQSVSHQLLPVSPTPSRRPHWSALGYFVFTRISWEWNHIICTHMCAIFTQNNDLVADPYCCMYQ